MELDLYLLRLESSSSLHQPQFNEISEFELVKNEVLLKILGLDYYETCAGSDGQALPLYKATRASSSVDITSSFELFRSLKTTPLFPKYCTGG